MIINHGTIDLFKNPTSVKKPGIDNMKSFPNAALSKLTTDISIDTLSVKDIAVTYSEYNKKSLQSGTIAFNGTYGKFLNITNNKIELLKNNLCTADLHTRFMNTGKLDVHFSFDLVGKDYGYSYKGHLGCHGPGKCKPGYYAFCYGEDHIGHGKVASISIYRQTIKLIKEELPCCITI